MSRRFRMAEWLLGVEGVALLRHVLDGDEAFIGRRLAAMRDLLADLDSGSLDPLVDVPELDVDAGYASWAAVYDDIANELIRAEEPLVVRSIEGIPPGHALDAACGTGRYAAALVRQGHHTIGVDRSTAMLAIAQEKVPTAIFRQAELIDLPLADGTVDVAVCALALTHLPDLRPAVRELARVLRSGGRLVISDIHPSLVLLQGQALFQHDDGLAFVRNYVHLHGTYLSAFAEAELEVERCDEAPMHPDAIGGLFAGASEAAKDMLDNIPGVLVWTLTRRPV